MQKFKITNPVGYSIELEPTPEQEVIFNKYFGAARYAYNFALNYYKNNLYPDGHYQQVPFERLTDELTKHKREEAPWLSEYDIYSIRMGLKDCHIAVAKYIDKKLSYVKEPKFKVKKSYYGSRSFAIRNDRITIDKDFVKLPSIGYVRIDKHTPSNIFGHSNKQAFTLPTRYIKYINPRVIFNGIKYYLTFSIEEDYDNNIILASQKRFKYNDIWKHKPHTDIIGIDMGCKPNNWLVASNGSTLSRPKDDKEYAKIKKLNKKFQRQLRENDSRWEKTNPAVPSKQRPRTKNELETLKKWNKLEKKIVNRKTDALQCYLSNHILQHKPEAVVIEDIFVNNMFVKDKSIHYKQRRAINMGIAKAMLSIVKDTIIRKCTRNDIPVILADKEFPSTQICSCCGNKTNIGKVSIYKCPNCGTIINRDLNAAINLREFGRKHLMDKSHIAKIA